MLSAAISGLTYSIDVNDSVSPRGVSIPPNPRGAELVRECVGFTITALILVALRFGIRIKRKALGYDDLAVLIALVRVIISLCLGNPMRSD